MSALVIVLLIICFAYIFPGILGFLPFLLGVMYSFFFFLIDLIDRNLYPVGVLPRILIGGTVIFLIVMFVIRLFTKNNQ